jgi:hypothetical protein
MLKNAVLMVAVSNHGVYELVMLPILELLQKMLAKVF